MKSLFTYVQFQYDNDFVESETIKLYLYEDNLVSIVDSFDDMLEIATMLWANGLVKKEEPARFAALFPLGAFKKLVGETCGDAWIISKKLEITKKYTGDEVGGAFEEKTSMKLSRRHFSSLLQRLCAASPPSFSKVSGKDMNVESKKIR